MTTLPAMLRVPALALVALVTHSQAATTVPGAEQQATPAPDPATTTTEAAADAGWWRREEDALLQGLGIEAGAGWFGIGAWRSTLDLRATGNVQQTTSTGFPDTEFYSYLTEQGLTIRNQGWYVLDPRLLVGDASVRFGFQQARQDADDVETTQAGDVTDYYLNITLLSEKPYTGTLRAARSEYVTSHAGGGTTSSDVETRGATLYWREASILRDREIAPYFSATLFAGREDLYEDTTNAGQRFLRDESRDRARFDAHNASLNSDLTLSLEQIDAENRVVPDASDRNRNADLSYGMDFGENLNRHADAHAHYDERTGDFRTESLDADVRLQVDHSAFFSTHGYYLYQDVDSPLGATMTQHASGGLQYMPFLNVTTDLELDGSMTELDGGRLRTQGVSGGLIYEHGLPASGNLGLSINGGLHDSDNELDSAGVPVVNAAYQAPPELGAGAGFLLRESDVMTESIVIFNVRDGARLPTVEGLDYEVEVEGNRTRIVPLPTSAVIRGGDPLEASYIYLVDPSLEFRSTSQSYSATADWSWVVVGLSHDVTREVPLSGSESTLLNDQDRTTLQVSLRGDWDEWRARFNARGARYRDDRLNYDEVRLSQNLSWRPSYEWQVGLDTGQSESHFLDSGRRSRNFDARLSGTLHSAHGWWTDGYLSWRTRRDSESADETITEAYLRLRRNWPQLTLSCSAGMGQRERGPVTTTFENLQVSITRLF